MTKVELTQHPVGQGGMMSGLIEAGKAQFHWVYDCGSNQLDPLNREIELVAEHGDVDCLFLSHLDSDHISGVDRLLSRVKVKQVVLPYLSDLDRVVAVAHDADAGVLSGEFQTFMGNVDGWFNERNVTEVTSITPNTDDSPLTEPLLQPTDRGNDETGSDGFSASWFPRNAAGAGYSNALSSESCLRVLSHGISWLLAPYAHRPSDEKLKKFQEKLSESFSDWKSDSSFIATTLRKPENIKKLRECYEEIWSDHNLVSMALYAGPLTPNIWDVFCDDIRCGSWRRWCRGCFRSLGTIGWMQAGDMDLHVKTRRERFVKYYKSQLPQTNVFVLPHHGSDHNFHRFLLKDLPADAICIAAAGPNSYGHPSSKVQRAVNSAGKNFVHVNDQPSSRFVHMCCK